MAVTEETIAEVARRHGLGEGAVRALWQALVAGGGRQAQFSHPELGGMGQWSGGMTQIGDMFDDALKAKVSGVCADLAATAASAKQGTTASFAASPGDAPAPRDWWPEDLGRPSSAGAQNSSRYAFFPGARRLAVERDGAVTVYDTGDHVISGAGQQQDSRSSMTFSSRHGPVRLEDLKRVER